MLNRVSSEIDAYAERIGIDHDFVTYCRTEMNIRTDGLPDDGSIPFGIQYSEIFDKDELNLIIEVREAYERSFMMLCLANAKNALDGRN